MYMCVGCGCSLLLIYVFPYVKIDSSIGLPSLNKVVTYLLTYLNDNQQERRQENET